jgi:hypothetical protein
MIFTKVTMKVTILWDATLSSAVYRYQCFRETCCLSLYGSLLQPKVPPTRWHLSTKRERIISQNTVSLGMETYRQIVNNLSTDVPLLLEHT